jgi:hypothetical protein
MGSSVLAAPAYKEYIMSYEGSDAGAAGGWLVIAFLSAAGALVLRAIGRRVRISVVRR